MAVHPVSNAKSPSAAATTYRLRPGILYHEGKTVSTAKAAEVGKLKLKSRLKLRKDRLLFGQPSRASLAVFGLRQTQCISIEDGGTGQLDTSRAIEGTEMVVSQVAEGGW